MAAKVNETRHDSIEAIFGRFSIQVAKRQGCISEENKCYGRSYIIKEHNETSSP